MKAMVLQFYQKSIPVFPYHANADIQALRRKVNELKYDFMFRKRWRRIVSIDLGSEVAIFQYNDGTKLYLEVAKGVRGDVNGNAADIQSIR
ncbi:hypothetical protein ACFQZR_04325 [Paenibacillus sp. GCM10027629]